MFKALKITKADETMLEFVRNNDELSLAMEMAVSSQKVTSSNSVSKPFDSILEFRFFSSKSADHLLRTTEKAKLKMECTATYSHRFKSNGGSVGDKRHVF